MFYNLRRFFNQNRKQIIVAVAVIAGVILLIQLLNYFAKQQAEEENNTVYSGSTQTNSKSPNVIHTTPSVSDGDISTSTATRNQEIINNFINACNSGEIEQAYNYLSSDCKNILFPTVNDFKSRYYDLIFTSPKEYSIENWITAVSAYTYKITFVNNILASGTIEDNIEDYITVVSENGESKLNIYRFIMDTQINKSAENNIAKIEVIDKEVNNDYEIYNIKFTNKSANTIMLNRSEDNDGIYVKYSGRDEEYTAFISEIYEQNLILERNQEKYLSIRINKIYNGEINTSQMVFSDIINNKNTFDSTTDKSSYNDISTIEINFN